MFERAPEIQEVGAGLCLWSNAFKALRRLGLEARVLTFGSVLQRLRTITAQGRLLNVLAGHVLAKTPWGRELG